MSGSTEQDILSNVPGLDDSSDASANVDNDAGGSGDSSGGAVTGGSSGGGRSSAAPTGQAPQQQPGTIRRRHDGLIEQPNPDNPNARDLVDPITGKTVARGGIERRVFEEGQRHARENNLLKQQLQQAQQHLQMTNQVAETGQRLGVPPDQQVVAIQIMADFMRDPIRTLHMLVEEVKSKGYQIPFLAEGVTPGMDLNAISRMIDSKMAPLTQRQQMEQNQQRERAGAQRVLDTFLGSYPDAEANLDTLAQMMQAQPSLSIHDAYIKMMSWCNANHIDYTQPIQPQVQRLIQSAEQQQNETQHQQPHAPSRPLPNGRSASGGNVQGTNDARVFNESSSWSDIIRSSMEESGMRLR